jgi:hypothetical protein
MLPLEIIPVKTPSSRRVFQQPQDLSIVFGASEPSGCHREAEYYGTLKPARQNAQLYSFVREQDVDAPPYKWDETPFANVCCPFPIGSAHQHIVYRLHGRAVMWYGSRKENRIEFGAHHYN